jgi:itaconyl-CoA hydratase
MSLAPAATHNERIGIFATRLKPGDAIPVSARRTVNDFDNIAVSLLAMNTHPAHTDYDYAKTSQFGKPLVVSPFLLSSLVAFVTNELREISIDGCEIHDLAFGKPIHPGDTITAEATVEEAAAARLVCAVTGRKASGEAFAKFRLILYFSTAQA